jgi:hypothetical protein
MTSRRGNAAWNLLFYLLVTLFSLHFFSQCLPTNKGSPLDLPQVDHGGGRARGREGARDPSDEARNRMVWKGLWKV